MGKKIGMIFSAAIGVFATIIVASSKGLLEYFALGFIFFGGELWHKG